MLVSSSINLKKQLLTFIEYFICTQYTIIKYIMIAILVLQIIIWSSQFTPNLKNKVRL